MQVRHHIEHISPILDPILFPLRANYVFTTFAWSDINIHIKHSNQRLLPNLNISLLYSLCSHLIRIVYSHLQHSKHPMFLFSHLLGYLCMASWYTDQRHIHRIQETKIELTFHRLDWQGFNGSNPPPQLSQVPNYLTRQRIDIFKNLLRQTLEISLGKAWFCRIDNFLNPLHQILKNG